MLVGGKHGDVTEGLDDVPADEVIAQREPRVEHCSSIPCHSILWRDVTLQNFRTLTLYLMISRVLDLGGTLLETRSGRLARCMVGISRGCERVCSWPVRPPPAEVRGVCMHAGSGGVYGC